MRIRFMSKLSFEVSFCGHKCYVLSFPVFFFFFFLSPVYSSESVKPEVVLQELTAKYQIKASFFPLPVDAEIIVEQLAPDIYEARIHLESRFLKVKQRERARIQNCEVQLLAIDSIGSRSNADDWNERVEVLWPEQVINYFYDEGKQVSYQSGHPPTGFATLFAHQFLSIHKNETEKKLLYTQSKKGVIFSYELLNRTDEIKNKLTRKKIKAQHFVVLRGGARDDHPPAIWYAFEEQGAFPVKLAIKIGVFTIEANLKQVKSGDLKNVNVQDFFSRWGCSRASID